METESAQLLDIYLRGDEDGATEIYNRYVIRLIRFAESRLSDQLRKVIDPQDVAQSALRSFFRRANDEAVVLKRSGDLWRTLAAFTLNKTNSRIEYEERDKRDYRRRVNGVDWERMADEKKKQQLDNAIEELTTLMTPLGLRDRQILEWKLQGYSVKEIADKLANPAPESHLAAEEMSHAMIRHVYRKTVRKLQKKLRESAEN